MCCLVGEQRIGHEQLRPDRPSCAGTVDEQADKPFKCGKVVEVADGRFPVIDPHVEY